MSENKIYDGFLAHDWGNPPLNHGRVKLIRDQLEKLGCKVWFDDDCMDGNIRAAMTNGIERSHCAIIFITERYQQKIKTDDSKDNCYFEFNYALHHFKSELIIPVVMEEGMRNTKQWSGRLASELGTLLYIDMSIAIQKLENDSDDSLFRRRCEQIHERMQKLKIRPFHQLDNDDCIRLLKQYDCHNIRHIWQEKGLTIVGEDLQHIETVQDLEQLGIGHLPNYRLQRILKDFQKFKKDGVNYSATSTSIQKQKEQKILVVIKKFLLEVIRKFRKSKFYKEFFGFISFIVAVLKENYFRNAPIAFQKCGKNFFQECAVHYKKRVPYAECSRVFPIFKDHSMCNSILKRFCDPKKNLMCRSSFGINKMLSGCGLLKILYSTNSTFFYILQYLLITYIPSPSLSSILPNS
jgi:hypothetical protein